MGQPWWDIIPVTGALLNLTLGALRYLVKTHACGVFGIRTGTGAFVGKRLVDFYPLTPDDGLTRPSWNDTAGLEGDCDKIVKAGHHLLLHPMNIIHSDLTGLALPRDSGFNYDSIKDKIICGKQAKPIFELYTTNLGQCIPDLWCKEGHHMFHIWIWACIWYLSESSCDVLSFKEENQVEMVSNFFSWILQTCREGQVGQHDPQEDDNAKRGLHSDNRLPLPRLSCQLNEESC